MNWSTSIEAATRAAASSGKLVLVELVSPVCPGCDRLNVETYAHPEVARFVEDHYSPCRIDVTTQEEVADRLGATAVPTTCALNPAGRLLNRTVGFQTPDEFIAEFTYVLAREALTRRDFETASRLLREVATRAPAYDRAPEALFWLGISECRRTGTIDAAKPVWEELRERWSGSEWAGRVRWWLG